MFLGKKERVMRLRQSMFGIIILSVCFRVLAVDGSHVVKLFEEMTDAELVEVDRVLHGQNHDLNAMAQDHKENLLVAISKRDDAIYQIIVGHLSYGALFYWGDLHSSMVDSMDELLLQRVEQECKRWGASEMVVYEEWPLGRIYGYEMQEFGPNTKFWTKKLND
jgi:hypothetical protein